MLSGWKTVIFNVLMLLWAGYKVNNPDIPAPPADAAGLQTWLVSMVSNPLVWTTVGNLVLRWLTTTPIFGTKTVQVANVKKQSGRTILPFLGLLVAIPLIYSTGCATLGKIFSPGSTANAAAQLAVEEATAVAIQAGCPSGPAAQGCYDAHAQMVLVVATTLKSANVGMALVALEGALNKAIAGLNLTPEEVAPMNALVQLLLDSIAPSASGGAISSAALADIQQVAGWVATEAGYYSPPAVNTAAKLGFRRVR